MMVQDVFRSLLWGWSVNWMEEWYVFLTYEDRRFYVLCRCLPRFVNFNLTKC